MELGELLGQAFDDYANESASAPEHRGRRDDFVFHMTDWRGDLEALARLYAHPDEHTRAAAGEAVFAFLIHALGHLNEAARLMLGETPDPFKDAGSS